MIKKVFLITEFGKPFNWTDQYIKNCGKLARFGWHWVIFTPNEYKDIPCNVHIVPMTIETYSRLVEEKLGVKTNLKLTEKGIPSVHITDFYIFSGVVFEDYIKGFDFWGITNMDVVYGRLDHFVSDELLKDCDVFTDDVETINGVFCLWRNNKRINNLFQLIENWKDIISQKPCSGCVEGGQHTLFGSDEYLMTEVMKKVKDKIKYRYPKYYPWHSHDRLEIHKPTPKLKFQDDGSLWELIEDVNHPKWEHARPFIGREVLFYHFSDTKNYPNV
jgi:hypothetical protein